MAQVKSNGKVRYEAPTVTDLGSVEELTQGQVQLEVDDFPAGSKVYSGVLHNPFPSLPPIPQP
jgi:hypothetical protein